MLLVVLCLERRDAASCEEVVEGSLLDLVETQLLVAKHVCKVLNDLVVELVVRFDLAL